MRYRLVAAISGNPNVCVGNTTQLNTPTTGGTWSSGNTALATVDASGLVTGVASGTVTISYAVTNGSGCTTAVTFDVAVHDLPGVLPITGTFSVCVNSTTDLNNGTAGGVWSSSDPAIASVNAGNGIVTGKVAGTATISYTVTDTYGCATVVTEDVIVNALPVPTLTGPNPICQGSVGNVYTTEAGQFNYVWNVVNGTVTAGGTGTDNTITITWDLPGTKSINVNYQDANGCSGATSATVANAPGTSPTITGPSVVCQNSGGHVYTTESGNNNYTWTINGGTIDLGAGTDAVTVTWTASGAQVNNG